MKTLRVSLNEPLFEEIGRTVEALGTTLSDFTRDALRAALYRVDESALEARHRAGYERHPVKPGEFATEAIQARVLDLKREGLTQLMEEGYRSEGESPSLAAEWESVEQMDAAAKTWAAELERRGAALESGAVEGMPGEISKRG